MNFIAIDFETANYYRDSACQIGLTHVKNSEVLKTEGYLINPDSFFDSFNAQLHGINEHKVINEPKFEELWPNLLPHLDNSILIAHNAMFDFGVLRSTLESRGLPKPTCQTYCTYQLAKKVYPGLASYSLAFLCSKFDIELDHHDANSDSLACAKLFLKICKEVDINSFEEIFDKLSIYNGLISPHEFSNPKKKRVYTNKTDISISSDSEFNTESPFFEKTIAITGTLSSMERKQAFQKIVDLGGFISDKVNKKTDYLIIGQTDFRQVGDKGASRKQLQAEALSEKGQSIEIVSEEFFLENI